MMKRSVSSVDAPLSPPPVKRKIESTTTVKAVSAFFKPVSEKQPEKVVWTIVDQSLVVAKYDEPAKHAQSLSRPVKVAAFDLDDTLISPNTGNKWERSATSWKWFDSSVPGRIRQLHTDGFLIVIISNQAAVSLKDNAKSLQKDTLSLKNLKTQLTSVLHQLDVPLAFYAATTQDEYRKPRTGSWARLKMDLGLKDDGALDLADSFYVGDAAGREKTDQRRKDHSSSDRELALNVGISFKTPEEFFQDAIPEPYIHAFDPKQFLKERPFVLQTGIGFKKQNTQEVVVFCGSPGSGKSSFFRKILLPQGYERINQDTLKTRDRCLKVAREALREGSSVGIDNTNASPEARAAWISLAKEFGVPARCIHFTASARLCEHNDAVRAHNANMNPENRTILPAIAFRSFAQRYAEPRIEEGFQDITQVDFQFDGSPEERDIFSRFWVSKFSA